MDKSVSFPIAKLLKEKGIVIKPYYLDSVTDYVEGYDWCLEQEDDTLKVREFQFEDNECSHLYLKPTIAEVVMYIFNKYGIWISVEIYAPILFIPTVCPTTVDSHKILAKKVELPSSHSIETAYQEAIDYFLNLDTNG